MAVSSTDQQQGSPRVSIVVPSYNAQGYIGRTLDSIIGQTFPRWEVVVFDDASSDATADVVESYAQKDPRIRLVKGDHVGVAEARNGGWAATDPRSEFGIFLDNDDLWDPELLSTLVGMLDANPDYVSAHCVARSIGSDDTQYPGDDLAERLRERRGVRGTSIVEVPASVPTTFAEVACGNCILTPGVHLIRRTVLSQVGGFDPATVPTDDWDMALRVSRFGPIGYSEASLLSWRRHEDAQSHRTNRWRRGGRHASQKMLTDPTNTPEQRRIARLVYRTACMQHLGGVPPLVREGRISVAATVFARALFDLSGYLSAEASLAFHRLRGRVRGSRPTTVAPR